MLYVQLLAELERLRYFLARQGERLIELDGCLKTELGLRELQLSSGFRARHHRLQ